MEFRKYWYTLMVYLITLSFLDNSVLLNASPVSEGNLPIQSSFKVDSNINTTAVMNEEGKKHKGVKDKKRRVTLPAKHKMVLLSSVAAAVGLALAAVFYYSFVKKGLSGVGKQLKNANSALKEEMFVIKKMFDGQFDEAEFEKLSAQDKEGHSRSIYLKLVTSPTETPLSDADQKLVVDFRVSVWTNKMSVYLNHFERYLLVEARATYEKLSQFVATNVPELKKALDAFDINKGDPLSFDTKLLQEKIETMKGKESCCKIKKLQYFLEKGESFVQKINAVHKLEKQMMDMCSTEYQLACKPNAEILKMLKE